MRKKRGVKGDFEEPQINLTSLIDVVFVILILFILIAPILEIDQVQLPHGNSSDTSVSVSEQCPISIHVRKDNQVLINQKLVSLEFLKEALLEQKRVHPGVNPQLFHDEKAHFGTYQTIKNAAESAGFERLDIVLKP